MPLNGGQLQRLLDATATNESSTSPADHMTVGTGESLVEARKNDWVSHLRDIAEQRAKDAFVMLNLSPEGSPSPSIRTCIMSPTGFPTNVVYAFLPPGSFKAWTADEARQVKQVVLHSFGHPWHSYLDSGVWKGVMNDPRQITSIVYQDGAVERIAWVPKGSDPSTFAHPVRLGTTLRTLATSVEGAAGTHFLIDRAGTLYVMCDCNNILKSSGSLSDTCVSVALEEALYFKPNSSGMSEFPMRWDPVGKTSNLYAWDYSAPQYVTLAALLYKLRLAYPALNTVTHSSGRTVDASFTGYTMHSHLKDARPQDIDIAPHLQTEEEWQALFQAVGQQSSLARYAVWRRHVAGPAARTSWIEPLVGSIFSGVDGSNPWGSIDPTMTTLAAVFRAHQEVLRSSKDYRRSSANFARSDSKLQEARLSVSRIIENTEQTPVAVLATKQPYSDEKDFESRQVPIVKGIF